MNRLDNNIKLVWMLWFWSLSYACWRYSRLQNPGNAAVQSLHSLFATLEKLFQKENVDSIFLKATEGSTAEKHQSHIGQAEAGFQYTLGNPAVRWNIWSWPRTLRGDGTNYLKRTTRTSQLEGLDAAQPQQWKQIFRTRFWNGWSKRQMLRETHGGTQSHWVS